MMMAVKAIMINVSSNLRSTKSGSCFMFNGPCMIMSVNSVARRCINTDSCCISFLPSSLRRGLASFDPIQQCEHSEAPI